MNHPIIVNAFARADTRARSNEPAKIFLIFKRANIFYKDSYSILTGTKEEVETKIKQAYADVESEKRDYPRADNIDLLDTPFDSWCNESCIYKRMPCCDNNTVAKCMSHWTHTEHTCDEEINTFVANIKSGAYPNYTIDYM
jgi:hypothetical protein